MDPNSPRKIQFTVPLLEPYLDPEAAEQIRRRRPTPATLVLTSDQSSPEIDEDRMLNPFLKSTLVMSPRQRKKMTRTTPTMKELQLLAEHHLCRQQQEAEGGGSVDHQDSLPETHTPGCCHHGSTDPSQAPGEAEPCGCLRNDSAEVETRLSSQESVHSDGSEGGKSGGATEHQAEDLSSDMQKIHIPQQDSTPDRSAGD
ncbi:protein phosphatase 1 regulatory subunit 1A isoform X1 [Ambystoma mexicanum]|uniref:protein phosphatase 1 regulatory subunit 1A isoform X1 n=1 Tax=Ambystoma mexicanum TaxID=8296 RepID=UPI0037E96495